MPEAAQCDAGRCVLSSLSVSSPSEVPPWYTCGGRGGGGAYSSIPYDAHICVIPPLFAPPHMDMVDCAVSVNIGMKATRGKVKLADGAACIVGGGPGQWEGFLYGRPWPSPGMAVLQGWPSSR